MRRHRQDEQADHNARPVKWFRPEPSLHELAGHIWELREMLVDLLQRQGDDRAGARSGGMLLDGEKKIPLAAAVGMVWGRSATRDPESTRNHEEILKIWATRGMAGIVLETIVARKRWMTSREAVERFRSQLGWGEEAPQKQTAQLKRPGSAKRKRR